MSKNYKKIWNPLILVVVTCLISCLFSFSVFADNQTYISVPAGENILVYTFANTPYYFFNNSENEVRVLFFHTSGNGNYYYFQAVALGQGSLNNCILNSQNSGNTLGTRQEFSVNGVLVSRLYYNREYTGNYVRNTDIPVVADSNSNTNAYLYTFGDYAVGADPVINYGSLIDLGYYTNFTNSQQTNYYQMRFNKDTIIWNGYEDSNGNQINTLDMEVEIQVYEIEYSGTSKSDLLSRIVEDLRSFGSPQTIYEGSANRGEVSFTWGQISEALTGSSTIVDFYSNLAPHSYENMWYSLGWLYRIRLKKSDDSYIGPWQTIYTVTSAPPEDSETLINYYYYYGGQGITPDVINSIQNINNINNTTNNWYVDGTQVDPNGSNWLETLLKFISDLIGRILEFFTSIFDGLVDLLLGLFDGINPKDSFLNWWSNLKDWFDSIDLTDTNFNLPNEDISGFWVLPQRTIQLITENNLGYILFIPLLVFILRLFL